MSEQLDDRNRNKENTSKPLVAEARELFTLRQSEIDSPNHEESRLEINIVEDNGYYQEVEIICGGKKRRRRITKLLPSNLANMVLQSGQRPSGSSGVDATKLENLSHPTFKNGREILLQEKFLRVLNKINQIGDKSLESIWDGENRINTTEKAILLAVFNASNPADKKLDRVLISLRSGELQDKSKLTNFVSDVLNLIQDPEKLSNLLFGDLAEKLGDVKKNNLLNCLTNIVGEKDDSKRNNQVKFLEQITNEVFVDGRGVGRPV